MPKPEHLEGNTVLFVSGDYTRGAYRAKSGTCSMSGAECEVIEEADTSDVRYIYISRDIYSRE